jgi:hypothetical protein
MTERALTTAERFAIRRLLDCGAVSEKRGRLLRPMYLELLRRGWAEALEQPDNRVLIRFSPEGRSHWHRRLGK